MKKQRIGRLADRPQRNTVITALCAIVGSLLFTGAGFAAGVTAWEWRFHRPLQADQPVLSNLAWQVNVDGNTRITVTNGSSGSLTFTNISVNVSTHPLLQLDVPGVGGNWDLEVGLHGGSLSNLHSSAYPGTVAFNLNEEFGWSGNQDIDIRISCTQTAELRELSLSISPGWVVFDEFDTHHWVGEFTSLTNDTNPHDTNNTGWLHPFSAHYSPTHPVDGKTALRCAAPIVTTNADNNFVYFKTVLPEAEDWTQYRILTFDPYMEEASLVLPTCGLVLKNEAGQEQRVPLILGWQLFQWENHQMTYPLQGNMMQGVQGGVTNWEIPPFDSDILGNVKEVTLGFEFYDDPDLETNYIHMENLRLGGVRKWDAFEGPEYGWHSGTSSASAGVSANRTMDGSAGALCITWTSTANGVHAETTPGAWEQNWSAYNWIGAGLWVCQPGEQFRVGFNCVDGDCGDMTTDVVTVDRTGEWVAVTWVMPDDIRSVSNILIEVVDPSASGKVYVDRLRVGSYSGLVASLQGRALKKVNRLGWSLISTVSVDGVRLICNTNSVPTNYADGTLISTYSPAAGPDYKTDHTGVLAGVTYHYGVFVEYTNATYSPASEDSVVTVSRDMLIVDGTGYEAGFSKQNGALLYMHDNATDRTISYGNEDQTLWHTIFMNETIPALQASWFATNRPGLQFSYSESPTVLSYSYASGTQSLDLSVAVDTWSTNRLKLNVTVTNRTAEAVRTVGAPYRLLFEGANVHRIIYPIQEGIALTSNFLAEGRYVYEPRPFLFADFVSLDSSDGLLSFYAIQDSTYGMDILRKHDTNRPIFQPSNIGAGASLNDASLAFLDYEMVTYVPPGTSWNGPTLVLESGGDSVRAAIANYTELNDFNNTNLYPTLEQKLDAFGLFDRVSSSVVLEVECHLVIDWQKAPSGHLWQTIKDDWVNVLPKGNILHFPHWQEGKLEHRHPDLQPMWEEKFGSSNELSQMLTSLHSGDDWLVMPFTDWMVWNKEEVLVKDGDDRLVPIPESCTVARSPDIPFYDYWGYMAKPWHTNVYAVNSNYFMYYKNEVPSDLIFVDMTCERTWRYTRIDTDGDGTDETVFTAYTQGLVDQNNYLKQFLPLYTEGVFDRMMGEIVGYCQSLRQKRQLDILAHLGDETDDWFPYPLAADVAHEKAGFYQHNLNSQVFPTNKLLLTHYTVMGYSYIVEVARWYNETNEKGENWMYICDAYQKGVAAKYFGRPLNNVLTASGGDERILTTSFGYGSNEITVIASFKPDETYSTGDHEIAPHGFLATMPGDTVIAGIFTNTFNSAPLSAGDHFIVVERVSDAAISVKQPHGPDTSITVFKPAAWTGQVFAVYVLRNGAEILAPGRVAVNDSTLVLDYTKLTDGGSEVSGYKLLDGADTNLPPFFLDVPAFEIAGPTQVRVRVRANKPVCIAAHYGVTNVTELTASNGLYMLSHALLVNLPVASNDYKFRIEITDQNGRSTTSSEMIYPAWGIKWRDLFAVDSGTWRDATTDPSFNATMLVTNGQCEMTQTGAPSGSVSGKILSETVTANLNEYPILEVHIAQAGYTSGWYMVRLQELVSPWAAVDLFQDTRAGTLILNIPELSDWSGSKTFGVEFWILNTDTNDRVLKIKDVSLRMDGNVAWQDEFNPPLPLWQDAYSATLEDNGDGRGRLRQNNVGETWGWVWSEMLAINMDSYPWLTVDVDQISPAANFKIDLLYPLIPFSNTTIISRGDAPYVESALLEKKETNVLALFKAAMVIEGTTKTALVDRIEVARTAPGHRLIWDLGQTTYEAGADESVWVPFTAVDYDGTSVWYAGISLPADAAFNGIFTWTSPENGPGTYNYTIVASNGVIVITNILSIVVTDVLFQATAIFEPGVSELDITWGSRSGETYRVEYSTNLLAPAWTALSGDVTATGWVASKSDDAAVSNAYRYYRIRHVD